MASRSSNNVDMLRAGLRVAGHLAAETIKRPKARKVEELPRSVGGITTQWLTAVLCQGHPGAEVVDFGLADGSRGTHERRRILVMYNAEGVRAGLPTSVFTKSLPSLVTRMLVGFMGHARYEMLFYKLIRPSLTIETPLCYYSSSDKTSLAALHVLEDVVHTKGARFLDERTYVDRAMAEGMVDLLAELHAALYDDPRLSSELSWLIDFPTWIEKGVERVYTDEFSRKAIAKAQRVVPPGFYARRQEVWPATMKGLELHRSQPSTVIHSDVHIGNWYVTSAGRMGLLDWQVLTRGHWSRDLAYAVSTALTVADRRRWERELVTRYVEVFEARGGVVIPVEQAFTWYRQQLFHALHMWTQTLCHPRLQPNSQRDEMTYELLRRITTAIDDLGAFDAFDSPSTPASAS
ncbi:aminoglycoside phosphotransferase family protein [Micromonospora globispora]|uniref:aminoglycoside phosphotransferase family protein n=1 Tax=Micromonospora globispora TaxID=1450148 RepID=UPI00140240DF|nr:aminoglycoside phosphotransferase family protein [Micromonospora globispora]